MLKHILVLCLLLCAIGSLSAIDIDDLFVGAGLELNAHTRERLAAGAGLVAGIDFNSMFAMGLKFYFSHNFDTVGALEPLAFFRYYLPLNMPLGNLFVQAEAGSVIYFEYGKAYPAFSGGLSAGWRFDLPKNWYVEPAVRGGYPFAFGVGVTAGYKFNLQLRKEPKTKEDTIVFSSVPENIVIEETKEGKTVRLLNAVYFEADKSVLIEKYRHVLDWAGERLRDNPTQNIILRGYTAPFGTPEGRAEISAARARICADYLAKNYGIAASRMKIESYGAEKSPEFKDASWESYRCVELIIE